MKTLPFLLAGVAATSTPALAAESGDLAGSVVQMFVGLAVVLALLLAALWAIKRLSGVASATTGLKVLGSASVGPRERVVLVEVADKVLVLGVAPGRVNALHALDAASLPQHPAPPQGSGDGFASRLQKILERRPNAR